MVVVSKGPNTFIYYTWGASSFNNPVTSNEEIQASEKLEVEIYGNEASGKVHVLNQNPGPLGAGRSVRYVSGSVTDGVYSWDDVVFVNDYSINDTFVNNMDTYLNSDGVLHVLTSFSSSTDPDYIYYRNKSAAGVWSTQTAITSGDISPGVSVALHVVGTDIYAVYGKKDANDLVMKYSSDGGFSWSDEVVLNADDGQLKSDMYGIAYNGSGLVISEVGKNVDTGDLRYYTVTASGGGGGGGVPEFSFYVWLAVLGFAGYMIYNQQIAKKNQFGA